MKRKMPLKVGKYQVLQVGTKEKKYDYVMCGVKVKSVQCAKGLGVKIASNLKFSQNCNDPANSSEQNVGLH